jgi:hypothetical protein
MYKFNGSSMASIYKTINLVNNKIKEIVAAIENEVAIATAIIKRKTGRYNREKLCKQ